MSLRRHPNPGTLPGGLTTPGSFDASYTQPMADASIDAAGRSPAGVGVSSSPLAVGLVGYGYWAPRLARNFTANPHLALAGIAERSPSRLEAAARDYPTVPLTNDAHALLRDPSIELVAIATEPEAHFALASAAVAAGKHVLITKPMTTALPDAEALVRQAEDAGRTLLVDHTVLFSPAVRRLKRYVEAGYLGRVLRFESTRANTAGPRTSADVVWDLAPHDIAVLLYVLGQPVQRVRAVARGGSPLVTTADITLELRDGVEASCSVTWTAETPLRSITLAGSRRSARYDHDGPLHRLTTFGGPERTVTVSRLSHAEALAVECGHVARVLREGERPVSGGAFALQVTRVLDASSRSIAAGGETLSVTS